jgi:integral membrane sensor domain MASE1
LPFDSRSHSWLGAIGLAVAVGIAYFMAARFGLAFRAKPGGVAVFWPAAGIAIGALIALGPDARLPVAAAVAVATIASKLLITGNLWLGITFGVVCAGQTLLTAWLVEHWFGRAFKLEDVPQVLGFLVASAVGAAMAAVGAVAAVSLVHSAASPLDVWRLWFASCLLGTVTVAPLLIGLGEAVRELPPRRELIEGTVGVVTLAALSAFLISLPQWSWATALPVALVFPLLLWIAVRCRPVFAAAAAFVVALAVIWSATFNMGHFGDASIPLADRILAAQNPRIGGCVAGLRSRRAIRREAPQRSGAQTQQGAPRAGIRRSQAWGVQLGPRHGSPGVRCAHGAHSWA